jgi:hypothetical protein
LYLFGFIFYAGVLGTFLKFCSIRAFTIYINQLEKPQIFKERLENLFINPAEVFSFLEILSETLKQI